MTTTASIKSRIHLRSNNQTYNVRELTHQYLVSSRYSIDKVDGGIMDNELPYAIAFDATFIPTEMYEIRNLLMFGSVS
jgi:hypothetical protein